MDAYTAMKKVKDMIRGDLRSLNFVEYNMIGIERPRFTKVKPRMRTEICHGSVSKPKLRMICGTMELTAE